MDMFSLFTADAAAKHGHEFSRAATSPVGGPGGSGSGGQQMLPQRRLPLPRSPLSILPRARSPNTLATRPRQRPHSLQIPMADLKEDPEGERADEEEELRMIEAKIRSFTIPGAFNESPPSSSPLSSEERTPRPIPSPSPSPTPEPTIPIGTTASVYTSTSASETAESSQLRRNSNKPKVFYRLGRPVHAERKHYLRPKCLLQVQEPGPKFHRPVYDVVPGSRFNPRTKIGQKLRRLRRNKDGTGADDLVVVKSEHHDGKHEQEHSEEEHDEEQETLHGQEVLGTIQPAEDGPSAYITLGDTVWKAALDGRGATYTLENVSDATERVRWYVPKSKRAAVLNGGAREFSFATLLPGTKRHPIVANMSEGHLEFYEEYCSPLSPDVAVRTDDAMRKLIIVSGLWVYFCEGWSKHYDFSSAVATSARPVAGRSVSARSANGFRGMLRSPARSPSRSPAPSVGGDYFSTSSDTRSREGSHDSAVTTVSPASTMIRHCFPQPTSQPEPAQPVRAASPDPFPRGRRRWSWTHHLRRFSHHGALPIKDLPQQLRDDTVITADIVQVENLPTTVEVEKHPLQAAFVRPTKEPTTIAVQSTGTAIVVDHKVRLEEPVIKRQQHQPTPAPPPPQMDGTKSPMITEATETTEHRLGLGSLARPKSVFTHRRADSSSSSEEEPGSRTWWHQYDRMLQKQHPIILPKP